MESEHPEQVSDVAAYNQAAKALGVSRKTIERMVKDGRLERDTSCDFAAVTKASLVVEMERRRLDLSRLTQALSTPAVSQNAPAIFRAQFEPLLDRLAAAQAEAADAKAQVRQLEERAQSLQEADRERAELVAQLLAGSWSERRAARKAALAQLHRAA